ncbi:lactate dehydrogenase [Methanofollis formosanus]|uniref:malate dehydrogenase n=1 Tax=Methanofollis formosanus TaxID=299308 RepID=A0A8G1A2W9_9EURY|nr:lactate dehydrogenase [Methanofollis formosanus]QYZ80046.1 lactate dehydrogenase [Methanofollis formosanus]
MSSLAVIGTGRVGGEVAFLAAALGLADELILCDAVKPLERAQVLDISHAAYDIVIETDPALLRDADVCIFTAGRPRTPDVKTRADLLTVNLPVIDDCCRALKGFGGVLITVTNPMDVNNYLFSRCLDLEPSRCVGFGGQLDSARFALRLAKEGIADGPAFILGEHGEHQVPVFSRLGTGVPVERREAVLASLRGASMEVIKGKGGTAFGPAAHIARLAGAVLDDRRDEVVPCSCIVDGEYGLSGLSIGLPARVGREGIVEIVEWDLDEWETAKLNEAAGFIKKLCRDA